MKTSVVIIGIVVIIVGALFALYQLNQNKTSFSLNPFRASISPTTSSQVSASFSPSLQPSPTLSAVVNGPGCKRSGCSGEICIEESAEGVVSTCIYKAEYGCLQQSKCEKQANGKCGFTITAEVQTCLDKTKSSDNSSVPQ